MSGGICKKSVEAYDYYENKWNYLPDMIEKRGSHASVSMGNKMFVIGGYNTLTCEIFDSVSRKFTYIKSINYQRIYNCRYKAVCIGQTIIVFLTTYAGYQEPGTKIFIYDVSKHQWSKKGCRVLKNLRDISCVKYYEE